VVAAVNIGDWLRDQGLAKYEKAFRENAIDLDILPDLADGDLAPIGVAPGERERRLKAILSFRPAGPISLAQGGAPPAAPLERAKAALAAAAERCPITVLSNLMESISVEA
jgi:hypothetical protein